MIMTMISTAPAGHLPCNMDWIQHKSIITKLYIEDDYQMPQLIAHMEQIYGFRATKNMYKKKFQLWNLRKNYRRQEKQALLAQIEERGEDALRDLQVHGKPILLGRVKRFEREEKNNRMAVPVRLVGEDAWTLDLQQDRAPKRRRKKPRVIHSGGMPASPSGTTTLRTQDSPMYIIRNDAHSEYMMHLVCELYEDALMRELDWHRDHHPTPLAVTQRNTSRDTRSGWPPAAFVDIGLALHYLLDHQSISGFWYLQRACQEIMSSLSGTKTDRLVEFHSMTDIVDLFCDPTWDAFPELRRHLLLYLMRLAGTTEGWTHPLTFLWKEFLDRRTLVASRDILQRRLNGGFEKRVGVWRIRLKCQWPAREPQQLLYGHSQWRWEREIIE